MRMDTPGEVCARHRCAGKCLVLKFAVTLLIQVGSANTRFIVRMRLVVVGLILHLVPSHPRRCPRLDTCPSAHMLLIRLFLESPSG